MNLKIFIHISWFWCLSLVIPFSGQSYAQEIMEFTIKEAQKYALENNYDVRNARLNIDAADKQRWEITANGFPQIQASAEYQKLVDIPTQLIPGEIFGDDPGSTIPVKFGKPHNATYGISVSQLVFSGSYIVGLKASKIYQQLSEQSYKNTELDVEETIAQTCYLILAAEENRSILNISLENLRKTHFEISAMYEEGFIEETDVKQLQISITGLENTLSTLDRQINLTYQLLKMQLGLTNDHEIRLKDDINELLAGIDVQARLEQDFNLQSNAKYQLLQTREHLADLSVKNEMVGFLPSIAAFASAQKNAQRDQFNLFDGNEKWFPTTVIGLQLNWQIFNGGSKIFKIQKAKVELKQAELLRKQAELGLDIEFNQAHSELSTTYTKYQNGEKNSELAKEIYDINLIKYKEGLVSSLDLIQSYNQYLQIESEYIMAKSELLNAQNKMDKLLNNY